MDWILARLRQFPADGGTSTSGGQQRPISRKESGSTYTSLGVDVKCCTRQHQVLVTYIRHALQSWGPSDELPLSYWMDGAQSRWKPAAPMQVPPELNRVLTRAKSLSEDCCRELSPLKAALRHAERSEAFADILKEIHWCTSVVVNTMVCRKLESDSAALKDFPWQAQLGYHELFLLESAAEEDWQQLLGELEIWKRNHHTCSVEDCGNMHLHKNPPSCLAGQVLRGLSPEELKGEQDHKSLLWSFDRDVLKHGRPLGSGSFGQVVEVTWLGFNYAQKIFNPAGLPTLPAEADALVKMNHPHIVKVFAYSEDSLLMDLMCMDLHKFIRSRMTGGARVQPFSLPAAIHLMLQIADAMSYIHSQKMAHRDLKPMNILVNPVSGGAADDGFVFAKIADFGLVKTKREITRYSHLTHNVGTRKYMAPEIFRANIEDDHLEDAFPMKADVYSFGIVCSEILSGEEPFRDVQLTDLYSKLTAPFPLRPRLPSSCPANLASLVCACWDSDPRERPAFVDVCRVLRYLKGLQLLTAVHESTCLPIDRVWPFGRLTAKVQKQGPWGFRTSPMSRSFFWSSSGPVGDIKAFRVHFGDKEKLDLRGFAFAVGEELRNVKLVGGGGPSTGWVSTDWIRFDHPSEYLVQVEGSYSYVKYVNCPCVSSVSFITTKQKYGPYGTFDGQTTPFCSDPGRVVNLDADSNLRALGVSVIRDNIFGCLRNFLDKEALQKGIRPVVMPTREQFSAAKQRVQYDPTKLHFAVCGASGSGKSSLVNAFRGLGARDEGSARVGVSECTSVITRYPEAREEIPYSRFVWYDIPGAGTISVPDWQYFNDQGLFVFDLIVLVYDVRFTTIDVGIIENCLRFDIPVLIVRSKSDQHIQNMINAETDCFPGDPDYEEHRREMAEMYVKATRSDFNHHMETMEADIDSGDQQLLYDKRVYIVSASTLRGLLQKTTNNSNRRVLNQPRIIDENLLIENVLRQAARRWYSRQDREFISFLA